MSLGTNQIKSNQIKSIIIIIIPAEEDPVVFPGDVAWTPPEGIPREITDRYALRYRRRILHTIDADSIESDGDKVRGTGLIDWNRCKERKQRDLQHLPDDERSRGIASTSRFLTNTERRTTNKQQIRDDEMKITKPEVVGTRIRHNDSLS